MELGKLSKEKVVGYKRTKILATVGPATNSYQQIKNLMLAGVNGFRLNFSHGTHPERVEQIKWIREASKELGKHVAILQDLQGPKIRLGDFEGEFQINKNDLITFIYQAEFDPIAKILPSQFDLSKKVKKGERILLFDGKVHLITESVTNGKVMARALNSDKVYQRKGMNLPDTDFKGDTITEKDIKDLNFGATQDIDYVAQSFVQSAEDVINMRKLLKKLKMDVKLIVKIETKKAIDNLEEIIAKTDMVMVARGDLATETMPESVPIYQRRMIELCRKSEVPVIVCTQMLASMVDNSEPTRAELSDVATGVFLGADGLMLSDETANGKFPIDAVSVMHRTIKYTEENAHDLIDYHLVDEPATVQESIAEATIVIAKKIEAEAIVAETMTGRTAAYISSRRPTIPIVAVTPNRRVAQQMCLWYGIKSFIHKEDKYAATKLTNILLQHRALKRGDVVVTASGSDPGSAGLTNQIKVRTL